MKTHALLLATVITFGSAVLPVRAQFTTSTVATPGSGDVGMRTSQAILASGNPSTSYYDVTNGDLKFASNSAADGSGTWTAITVVAHHPSPVGSSGTSLAIVNGRPAIAYSDNSTGKAMYVRATDAAGTAWGTPVAISTEGAGAISLAVINGLPGVCFQSNSTGNLKYVPATDVDGTAWGMAVIVAGSGNIYESSLASVEDKPAISYYTNAGLNGILRYTINSAADGSGTWTTITVDSTANVGQECSLAVVGGFPAISYRSYETGHRVKYARSSSTTGTSGWTLTTVDSSDLGGVYETSLAVVNGKPAISYSSTNFGQQRLQFARNSAANGSGAWTTVVVDAAGDVGHYGSLVVAGGKPVISYYDATNGDLKFARNAAADGSGAWTAVVADAGIGIVGLHASQAIVGGNPAICFYDAGLKTLNFTRNSAADGSGTWTTTTVDSTADVGQFCSLAVVGGFPAISYYDATSGALKFARNSAADGSGTWTAVTVDATASVGQYTSLAEVNGNPAISYGSDFSSGLKFARNSAADGSGTWTVISVDGTNHSCRYTALAVINGTPAIAYCDNFTGNLNYVRATDADGAVWPASQVGLPGGSSFQYLSLAVVNGNPAISCYLLNSGDLNYIRANDASGASWPLNRVTVSSVGDVGAHTSLVVVDGKPAISYYDATNGDLNYVRATDANGASAAAWGTPVTADSTGDVGQYTSMTVINGRVAIAYLDATNSSLKWAIKPSSNADLSNLALSAGTLTPIFASGTLSYTASVPNATTSLTVTPTLADMTATVTVNGTVVVSGSASGAIALNVGSNAITTVVTAQDGSTKTYTTTVTRLSNNADLSNLALSAGTLTPAFASGTVSYTASVPNTTTSLTVTPTVADSTATVMVNGSAVASGSASGAIALNLGSNVITTVVTAQDGSTKTYTATVTRLSNNADLSNLALSAGTLTPAFTSGTISYTASVPNATTSLTVTPTLADMTATVTVNGQPVTSGSPSTAIALNVGSNVITTVVTAQDTTTKTYTTTVTRSLFDPLTLDAGSGADVGLYTSQTIVDGTPAISYYDSTNGDLKFARNSAADGSGTWTFTTVASAGDVGEFTSLAVVDGHPAISYYDSTNRDLNYVRASDATGTAWGTPVTLDTTGAVGRYSSLAVVNGSPAISYYSDSTGDLRYLRATDASGTTWGAALTLDSNGFVGTFSSLAVVDGWPAISYYDGTNQDLKYVRASDASGAAWGTPITLSSAGIVVGEYTSLVVVNGSPAISYYDSEEGELKYMRASDASGTTWGTPIVLDSTGNVGQHTSLAVINGSPAISYYDVTNGDLKYLRASDASGTTWGAPKVLDSTGDVGLYTSLAVVDGRPSISYYDVTNGDLKWVILPPGNANLSALALSTGTLTPAFVSGTVSYTASVPNTTTSLTLTPTLADMTSTVTVNGVPVTSGSPSAAITLNLGANVITTLVTSQNGNAKTYTTTVTRLSANADLSALALSTGTLTPAFATGTTSYTASVPNATTSITVTPTVADATAMGVTVNGVAVTSGNASGAIALNVGSNVITTVVTAQDGSMKTYTTTVTRLSNNSDLSNLALSAGTLTPIFASGTLSYTASVPNATESLIVTPTVADATATVMVNGVAVTSGNASGAIPLSVGSNVITTVVTAQDASTKTYTITVTRPLNNNADLSGMAFAYSGIGFPVSPAFDATTTSYAATLANSVAAITVTPTVAAATASVQVRVNGGLFFSVTSGTASGVLPLNGGANPVEVKVTAQDGSIKTYTTTVTRQSNTNLLAYEGFDYTTGTIYGKAGGFGFSSAWAIGAGSGTNAHAVAAGSISASGVSTVGNRLSVPLVPIAQANTGYCSRTLTTAIGVTGTTRYFSAVMRGDGTIGDSLAKFGGFFGVQFDGAGANDLIAGLGGAGTVPKPWQVEQIGGVGTPGLSNVPVVSGVPVLMVMKLEFLAGADRISLFINPTTIVEPTVPDALKTDKDTGTLSILAMNNGGAFSIDEIRLGTTFADVVPGLISELTATWTGGSDVWISTTNWETTGAVGRYPNNGSPFPIYDAVLNNGSTISLNQNVTVRTFTDSAGVLSLGNGAQLTVSTFILRDDGTLQGSGGTINGPVIPHVGSIGTPKISPGLGGATTGILNVNGSVTLGASMQLRMDAAGTTAGTQYDKLVVTGPLELGSSSLVVTLPSGYTPAFTDTFTIATATSVTGSFANTASGSRLATADGSGSFLVNYGPSSNFPEMQNSIVLSGYHVTDNTAPVLTVPASPLVIEATGTTTVVDFSTRVSAVDAIDGPRPVSLLLQGTATSAVGYAFPLGDTVVVASTSDLLGNASTQTFTVTVADTTAPMIAAHLNVGPIEATSAAGATVTYAAATATDAVTASPTITYSHDSGTVFPLGVTTVTITAKDAANNTSTSTFTVTVSDTTAPAITAHANVGPIEATSAAGATVTYAAATATDAVTASPTITYSHDSGTVFPLGVTTVTITAKDAANNTSTSTFTVTVSDTTAPAITAHANVGPIEATSAAGATVTYAAATATDAVTASPTITYSKNSGTVFPLGTTTVTISATDDANNTGTGTFTVTVVDTTAPTITVPSSPVSASTTSPLGTAVTFSVSATDLVSGSIAPIATPASGSVFPIGNTTVNVIATDGAGNTANSSFTVTVTGLPDIAIELPLGTEVADGGSVAFGSVSLNTLAARTFTLKNSGAGSLTGLGITVDGADASLFTVTANPTAPVAPGDGTTFTVQFAPITRGLKTAVLHLVSNDPDENPYDITLTGTGGSSNANLDSLGIVAGSFSFGIDGNTTSYNATVQSTISSLKVIPVVAAATSTVTVNGIAVASDTSSPAIPLDFGSNIITTVVTAEDGITTKTYTGIISRELIWNLVTADTGGAADVGLFTSQALVGGNPAIAYYDSTNTALKFARNNAADGSGLWSALTVNNTGDTGLLPSLAVLVDGKPAISFYDSTLQALRFSRNSISAGTGAWITSTIVGSSDYNGQMTSLKVVNGRPAISCVTASGLTFMINSAVDGSGTWTASTVGDFVNNSSLAVVDGKPAIAYSNGNGVNLAVNSAVDGSGTWTLTTVDNSGGAGEVSLAVIDGKPAISYNLSNSGLKFAINSAADGTGTWTLTTVDNEGDVGAENSLAVVNGKPAISYFDGTNFDLKFAINSAADGSGFWTLSAVDSTGNVGQHTSLAVLANGAAAISYFDQTNSNLKWAKSFQTGPTIASLAGLSLSTGTLSPVFNPLTTSYSAHVSASTSSVTLMPAVMDSRATPLVRVNGGAFFPPGVGTSSFSVPLHAGPNSVQVQVTAQDGVTTKSYFVSITREAPLLGVEQGTPIASGGSKDFGSSNLGSPIAATFTIKNTGGAPLHLTSVSVTGGNAADFVVNTTGMSTSVAAPTGQTTFSVTFNPSASGPRSTTLRIVSDDPEQNPYDITLNGLGASSPIMIWRQFFFGTTANSGTTADTADFDLDGTQNLIEYGFATNPTSGAGGSLIVNGASIVQHGSPITVPNGASFNAVFARRLDRVAAGLTYTVEFSANLNDWEASAATPTVIATDAEVEVEAVSVPFPTLLVSGQRPQFFRVTVSITP